MEMNDISTKKTTNVTEVSGITYIDNSGDEIQFSFNEKDKILYTVNGVRKVKKCNLYCNRSTGKIRVKGVSCGSWSGHRYTIVHPYERIGEILDKIEKMRDDLRLRNIFFVKNRADNGQHYIASLESLPSSFQREKCNPRVRVNKMSQKKRIELN
eukprot:UN33403